jgi:tetratricopeptide (TPR) repeat protein
MSALLLVLALQAQDPVQVGARLTDAEIHAGETTILRVDVETEGERARVGRFRTLPPGIEVAGTRDYDQRQFSLPGGTRRFITREFVLRARAAGRYRIPSLEVTVDGRVYSTESLLLTVTSAPARERGETRGGDDGVVLRAWLDADTVYVGEQVTLQVDAMFSQTARMRLRRAPEYEAPSPSGFWVHELPDPGRPVSRTIGDEIYEVQRFRRAFFPLSAGSYTIPPARLEYEMRRGLLYAPETRELSSDPLPLVVLPVPASAPPAFHGAVGDYEVTARVEPASVPVGEAAVLTVTVEGVGNVKALPAPVLPELAGIDVFPPSEEAETATQGTTIRGRKVFSWVLIPRQAGEREVPAIRYAFFDPDRGGFETATVGPIPLTATPAAGTDPAADAPAPATIRFLKTSPAADPLGWVRSPGYAGLMALPLLLLGVAWVLRRRQGRAGHDTPAGLRRERKQAIRRLEARAAKDHGELFAEAETFARDWLARRLGLERTRVTDPDALTGAGVPAAVADGVRRVLDRLSAGRYAPTPPEPAERTGVIGELARVLEAVDGAAPAPAAGAAGQGARATAVGMVLVTALAGTPAHAVGPVAAPGPYAQEAQEAQETEADLFVRGLVLFENGDYTAAARTFDRYTRRAPRDPAGWYNLGTSYHRAGHEGWGVWAWLRAVRLDPRDADARHNLRVAGAPPELVQRATPALPLRPSELLLLGGLFWLLAGGSAAVWVVRRRRAAGIGALASLAVALLLAGVWWGSTRAGETLIVRDGATLRAGPALRAEPVAALEPGAGLVPVDRYGEWVRARTLRGEEGWIERNRTGSL